MKDLHDGKSNFWKSTITNILTPDLDKFKFQSWQGVKSVARNVAT